MHDPNQSYRSFRDDGLIAIINPNPWTHVRLTSMATPCRQFEALMLAPAHEIAAQHLVCRTVLNNPLLFLEKPCNLRFLVHPTAAAAAFLQMPNFRPNHFSKREASTGALKSTCRKLPALAKRGNQIAQLTTFELQLSCKAILPDGRPNLGQQSLIAR